MDSLVNIYIVIPLILIPQLLLSGVTVRFDDLHKSLTSRIYTPFIGDLTFSRWAYEALTVQQAVNNRFDRHFFEYDQRISEASFKSSYLIPRLVNKLEECNRNLGVEGNQEILQSNLSMIRTEIRKLGSHPDLFEFELIGSLNVNDFDDEVSAETMGWLNYYVKDYFIDIARDASREKDRVYNELADSLGAETVFAMKQDHQNDRLLEIVTNRNDFDKILEIKGQLVQKDDPIYMIPESNIGRAQFYAPFKKLNGVLYDTLWYNLGVLWGFSFILYVVLLLDVLRKLLDRFSLAKRT
jgi:hypothetical protein